MASGYSIEQMYQNLLNLFPITGYVGCFHLSDDVVINTFVHLAFLFLLNYCLMIESQEWDGLGQG